MASREEMSRSFGAAASAYEAGRPEYPDEAVEWMLAPLADAGRTPRVADVGAGTGKLTRALVELGADAVAIEPDEGMLAELRRAVAGVDALVGSAESLPLPDGSVDGVVLGQAWHWVDPVAASAEIGRVVRPGGILGLIWNIRDESVPWVARLGATMRGSHAEQMLEAGGPVVEAPFGEPEERRWTWERPVTRAGLLDLVRSRSYVITAPEEERARIERELGALCDEIGAVGDATIPLRYVTRAYRAERSAS